MADRTAIEWTDATWNPLRGCTRVSEGCKNCYAEIMAARFSKPGQWGHGLATMARVHHTGKIDHRWTGKVILVEDQLDQPLRWKRPRRIFVNSTSDLFHESVPDEWIDRIFAVMALAPQHTFQVLTKRPERMRAYIAGWRLQLAAAERNACVALAAADMMRIPDGHPAFEGFGDPEEPNVVLSRWPLPNVWLGTSIEDQATADARIPQLLATPAAVRFVSAEPLLGPVDLTEVAHHRPDLRAFVIYDALRGYGGFQGNRMNRLDWVIVGGESGPGARPMHPDWARSLRDQCQAAGVAFFFKQWGEWAPCEMAPAGASAVKAVDFSGRVLAGAEAIGGGIAPVEMMSRLGKGAAGRLLDGREWNQMPGVRDA
jgi:protein gp37